MVKQLHTKESSLIALDLCQAYYQVMITKDDQLIFRCFECKDFNKDLINRFANTYEFCKKDINKFILFLRKGIHFYEYIDSWEIFDETSLPDKEAFYCSLNMEGITSVDFRHAKRVYREFNINNLDGYHDLYVQSDTLLLADVFENFRNVLNYMNLILLIFYQHLD